MSTQPLHFIEEIERTRDVSVNLIDRAMRWLDDRLPILLRRHIPYGRLSAEHLLSKRTGASYCDWSSTALPEEFVRGLLDLVVREYEWPNCHFVPEDPFRLVVVPPSEEEFPLAALRCAVRETFDCEVTLGELTGLWVDCSRTVGEFARLVYERAEPPA